MENFELILAELLHDRGLGPLRRLDLESELGRAWLGGEKILVYLVDKVVVAPLREAFTLLEQHDRGHLIMIYQTKVAPKAGSMIQANQRGEHPFGGIHKVRIELFHQADLTFNPTKHRWVPPHHRVNREVLGNLKPEDLRTLLTTDRIARWYDFQPGEIIQVDRPEGLTFCCVTEPSLTN